MRGATPRPESPGGIRGPGLLEEDRGGANLTFRRLIPHPIQAVWDAITDPEQLQDWFMAKVRREDGVGGHLVMEHPNETHATGKVLAWDPPYVYEYEWNLPPGRNRPTAEASVVRWELSTSEGGTLLVMTHRRLSRPAAETFSRGFSTFLDRLSAHLDDSPLPNPPWVRSAPTPRDQP
jgi:uncharacterized protein YndB with AHSA1/START domain